MARLCQAVMFASDSSVQRFAPLALRNPSLSFSEAAVATAGVSRITCTAGETHTHSTGALV